VLLLRVPSSSSPAKGLYNPKAFITHAASLDQGCPHCPRFPTAASRRSLGRVSVPVWLTILSDQLPIIALVGRHPTNQLIGRGPIPGRRSFGHQGLPRWRHPVLAAVSRGCPGAQGRYPRVTHPCATRCHPEGCHPVRLACVKRAASVRSEPGSNSQLHPRRDPSRRDPCHGANQPPPGHRCPCRDTDPRSGQPAPRAPRHHRASPPLQASSGPSAEKPQRTTGPQANTTPAARPPPDRQPAPTREPASTQDAQDQRPTSRRPRIPSLHHLSKSGRSPESQALANETDPIGAPSSRS
jgi:hypothetical protein